MNNLRKLIRKEVRSVMDGKRFAVKDDYYNYEVDQNMKKINESLSDIGAEIYGFNHILKEEFSHISFSQRQLKNIQKKTNEALRNHPEIKNNPDFKEVLKETKILEKQLKEAKVFKKETESLIKKLKKEEINLKNEIKNQEDYEEEHNNTDIDFEMDNAELGAKIDGEKALKEAERVLEDSYDLERKITGFDVYEVDNFNASVQDIRFLQKKISKKLSLK